jgi:GTPase SAR1 family protein
MEFHKVEMDVELPLADNPAAVQAITSYKAAAASAAPGGGAAATSGSSSNIRLPAPAAEAASSSSLVSSSSFMRVSSTVLTPNSPPALSYKLTVPELPQYGGCSEQRRAIVKVWDIQGQDQSKIMTRTFYSRAVGALIFCELTKEPESLEQALLWKKDVCEKVFVTRADKSEENPPCWLVVNKYDLLKDMPTSSYPAWASRQQLDQFCEANGFFGWSYAAGLKGLNVRETVEALVAASISRFPAEIRSLSQAGQSQVGVNMQRTRLQQKQEDKGCACKK